jgi:plastocyanin
MKKLLALLIACLAFGIAAGCGGDDNGGGDGGGSAASTTETTETTQAQETTDTGGSGGGKTAKVVMKDIKFDPQDATVAVGGTVEWTNEDSAPHDVTKTGGPGPKFSSGTGNLNQGDTYKQTFDTAGTISYVCTVHPGMEGKITVK